MTRDEVLAGRISVALIDAKTLYDSLSILNINPPAAGTAQEEAISDVERAIRNAAYYTRRLREWVK